ncbi:MAG: DNA methylase [Bacteroidales bacterium]|nr:DNA methylase [Bacteroidales bacterium]
MDEQRTYIAIDLKSFYASVECVERGLNPLTTNLVVADASRTEKTICLAVTPSLKAYGIGGRARLFEVVERLRQVNAERQLEAPHLRFTGKSTSATELANHPEWAVDYITAPPRMAFYMEYSSRIYSIYLRYIAPEDIHVYSIDEVFMDVTNYLTTYKMTAHELTMQMIREVLRETGITATAGIGTNLYLAKIAMDIEAKHMAADSDGVRIAELDETSYRQKLWNHRPLTDFWRVGRGIARRLEQNEIYTMGMVARCSLHNEELLYKLFGVGAELLIDHAWGWEPTTMQLIKQYRPESNSLSSSQVLSCAYSADKARIVVQEMADNVALGLVAKGLVADQVTLTVGYDTTSLTNPSIRSRYQGGISKDWYGRTVPTHAHGTAQLGGFTSSSKQFIDAILGIFDRTVNPSLLIRRITIGTLHVVPEGSAEHSNAAPSAHQMSLFEDYESTKRQQREKQALLNRERRMQEALIGIKQKYGKNAILKGINFEEGATAKERNRQIGGHRS